VWQHQTICHKRILLPLTTEASLIVWQEIKGYNETIVLTLDCHWQLLLHLCLLKPLSSNQTPSTSSTSFNV